jgi:hypothetical protein
MVRRVLVKGAVTVCAASICIHRWRKHIGNKNKKPTANRQWVSENLVNDQNPTAALVSSSAFVSSRFRLRFTTAT